MSEMVSHWVKNDFPAVVFCFISGARIEPPAGRAAICAAWPDQIWSGSSRREIHVIDALFGAA